MVHVIRAIFVAAAFLRLLLSSRIDGYNLRSATFCILVVKLTQEKTPTGYIHSPKTRTEKERTRTNSTQQPR
ncbi:unnamed protein product [Ectocarpus fasciculatus]